MQPPKKAAKPAKSRRITEQDHIAIVGLGNIGTILAPLVARLPEIRSLTLIDPQRYEPSNLKSQAINPSDIGKLKVHAVARHLLAFRPELRIQALPMEVQDVPLGFFRDVALLCGCLDSKSSRCSLNEIARILAIPYIDAGVEPSAMLARVNVYRPTADCPCYECALSPADYQQLDVRYPCQPPASAPATNAPLALGCLAASLQAIEAAKLLRGQLTHAAVGQQVTISAETHKHYVTSFRVNPQCRCPHESWTIRRVPVAVERLTLAQVARLAPAADVHISIHGHTFIREFACACGFQSRPRPLAVLARRVSPRQRRCPKCRKEMMPVGYTQSDSLALRELLPQFGRRPLSDLGFQNQDVFTLRWAENERRHYLLDTPIAAVERAAVSRSARS